jgi:hypothetical protein
VPEAVPESGKCPESGGTTLWRLCEDALFVFSSPSQADLSLPVFPFPNFSHQGMLVEKAWLVLPYGEAARHITVNRQGVFLQVFVVPSASLTPTSDCGNPDPQRHKHQPHSCRRSCLAGRGVWMICVGNYAKEFPHPPAFSLTPLLSPFFSHLAKSISLFLSRRILHRAGRR